MRHKRVADVMTRDVVTVHTDTPFRQVVRALAEHGVSGLPVLDADDHVVGIVTEADVLGRQARAGGAADPPVWHLVRRKRIARRDQARTAADLMSTPIVAVAADDRLTSAAATLARNGVKRAPVLDADGALHGIVSRKDLLSVYLRADADLAAEIREEVLTRAMCVPPPDVTLEVRGGIVTLRGKVERQSMIEIITVLTQAVDGVVEVRNEIRSDYDDTDIPPPPPENVGILHRFIERG
ncbi:CBS domain-containing protein [Nocardia sp. ET3-3]|uniref:CBS domain-containing protein n=1 Tax=Nocardia terrae TaxID=2675851 RepID=A0A7K1UTG2_9NOCA|nr:CBS domain-containing protein [Nocardia terrae]MVU77605.1 CBS domain-containing protein [Nocardia terrae]